MRFDLPPPYVQFDGSLCSVNVGYCTEPIGTWAMCGGNYTCPVGTGNCDAPWPQRCCSASNDVCIRKDATWWRCEPQGTPSACHTTQNESVLICNMFHHHNSALPALSLLHSAIASQCVCHLQVQTECIGLCMCCVLSFDAHVSAALPPWCFAVTADQPPKGTPPPPLVLQGNRLVNAWTGGNVAIRGVNWFGFNVGATMVDGLWAGGSEAATDFQTITYQLRYVIWTFLMNASMTDHTSLWYTATCIAACAARYAAPAFCLCWNAFSILDIHN